MVSLKLSKHMRKFTGLAYLDSIQSEGNVLKARFLDTLYIHILGLFALFMLLLNKESMEVANYKSHLQGMWKVQM